MASDPEWRYFADALAWYPPNYGLTGAQTFSVVQQIRAALKDERITPEDLGLVPPNYDLALHCRECGHLLLPHNVTGHEKWHEEPRR